MAKDAARREFPTGFAPAARIARGGFPGWSEAGRGRRVAAERAVVGTVIWNGALALAGTATDGGKLEQEAPTGAPVQATVTVAVKPLSDLRSSW